MPTKIYQRPILLIVLAGILWFAMLGYRDLIDPDEGRYAEVARAMLSTDDWVTPRLNGYKFFDKPPLQYWGSAISMAILGETNTAARLWCAGTGFLGTLWMGFVAYRLYSRCAAQYTFLILISSFLYYGIGHANVLDMGVSVFLSVAIGAFALAQTERNTAKKGHNWMLLSWAGLAAAVLSKGLIGIVFPGAAIIFYSLWQRDWALWKNLFIIKGLSLFLLLVLPWFILVSQANEQFLHFFFIHEHFERFTSTVHNRDQPWWYFVVVLSVGFLPWIANIISAIFKPEFSWKVINKGEFEASRLFWVYAVFIFLFFSRSHSKLVPYIVPIFPFLAILAGEKLAKHQQSLRTIISTALLAIIVAIVAWKIIGNAKPQTPLAIFLEFRPWLIAAAISLASASAIAFYYRQKQPIAFTIIAMGALLAFNLGASGYQSHSRIRSAKAMATAIQNYSDNEKLAIYSVNHIDYSLIYYLKRHITLIEYTGNMSFGISREAKDWIPTKSAFKPIWQDAQQAVAIMSVKTYQSWKAQGIPMNIIYQDPRRYAVTRN
jgi:4-amino-4-deoxy-L-arabinose transferase-like glycosyltransferase